MDELEGTELVKAVADRVMGWFDAEANPGRLEQPFFVARSDAGLGVSGRPGLWNFLTSMSDAFEVVNAIESKDGSRIGLLHFADAWEATFWIIGEDKPIVEVECPTLGEAIARAALAAVKEAGG